MPELTPQTFCPVTISLSPAIDGGEGLVVVITDAGYIDDPGWIIEPGMIITEAELRKHAKRGVQVYIRKDGALSLYLLITQEAALEYAGDLLKSVIVSSPERLEEAVEMVMQAAKAALEESRGRPEPPVHCSGPGSVRLF